MSRMSRIWLRLKTITDQLLNPISCSEALITSGFCTVLILILLIGVTSFKILTCSITIYNKKYF